MANDDALYFRLATTEDAARLETLINTAFRYDPTTEVFLSLDHVGIDLVNASRIQAMIAQPDCSLLVAVDKNAALVAHSYVRRLDDKRAWFGLLAVDLQTQKRGLGSKMLVYAEEYVRQEWGAQRMEFDVVRTRAGLIAWYEHRGYRATGETKPFPYEYHNDWEGTLRNDLWFIIMGKDLDHSSSNA